MTNACTTAAEAKAHGGARGAQGRRCSRPRAAAALSRRRWRYKAEVNDTSIVEAMRCALEVLGLEADAAAILELHHVAA